MKRDDALDMPEGLPTRFVDPKTGFTSLCGFLKIATRSDQQKIVKIDGVKRALQSRKASIRGLSTSKRLEVQITKFYSLPHERQELWKQSQKATQDITNEFPFHVPSIEYQAFKNYDPDFFKHEFDETHIGKSLSDIPGVAGSVSASQVWQLPALAAWRNLRSDLLRWETLPTYRRDAVTLATFAVATILNDARFLEWAARRTEILAREYEFALDRNPRDTETAPEKQGKPNQPAEDEIGEIVRKWNEACTVVAELALKLGGDHPRPERLNDLIKQVRVLEGLREPLGRELDSRYLERLVNRIAGVVSALARNDGVYWLSEYTSNILAQWKSYYITHGDGKVEQLQQNVDRMERELKHAVREWRLLEDAKQNQQQQLQELEASSHGPGDLLSVDDREVELQAKIATTTRELRDARRRIFQVIAPHDSEFDPSRDYECEYGEADILGTDREYEDIVQEQVESPDRESSKEVADAADAAATDDDRQGAVGPAGLSSDGEDGAVEEAMSKPSDIDNNLPATDLTSAVSKSRPDQLSRSIVSPVVTEGVDDMAVVEPSGEAARQDTVAVATLWRAIDIGRFGIAYHIAKLLAKQGYEEGDIPPANLIAASALADHVQSADGEVVVALRSLLENIDPDNLSLDDYRNRDAVNLLLFSATLRPALFAPSTGVGSMLRCISAPELLTPVYKLATAVANHADRLQGIRLDATLIKAALHGHWHDEFTTFVARVGDWRKRAESQRIIFHRANRVWQKLFSEYGCLAELVALISKDDTAGSGRIESIRKQISEQKAFNALVQRNDPKHRKSNPIQGSALKQLWDHVQPAIDLSSEWLRLKDAKPDPKGFVADRIEALRRDLVLHGNEAVAAIDRVVLEETSVALTATLKNARNTIEALLNIFDNDSAPAKMLETSPDVIRSRDLLYVAGLDLDMEYRPANHHGAADILGLLLDTGSHAETLSAAFKARLSRGDITGAQLACEGMDAEGDPEANRCRTSLDQKVELERRMVKKAHAAEEGRLERAFCRGQLGIDERDDLATRLVSLKRLVQPDSSNRSSPNVVDAISNAKLKLTHIQQSIETSSAARINEAKSRFKAVVSTNPGAAGQSIIGQAIESGDILTANELISRIEKGESVELPTVTADAFQEFMSTVKEIDREVGAPGGLQAQVVVRGAAARQHIAGVSFENLSEKEAEHAGNLLKAWYTLSKIQRVDKPALQSLLQQLGFHVHKISIETGPGWPQADLVTEAIEDRSICPSRQFGSEARGHYRILLNWKRPSSDLIAESLGVKGGAPTVVLHFGCLGANRERLRTLAVQTHRLFLVIDESLILFLATRPSGRLSALFRSTLPFTSIDPYATTSSLVPPELFYGREREQREITDQSGSCFIYGGRQLGKTALLRCVERDFNRSRETNVAKWIDLKVNEIGYARGARDIWPLLQRELESPGIVRKRQRELDPENRRQVKSLLDEIQQWINDERKDRRLLLLLDEADAFLEQDARTEFRESTRIKGLMDKTDRRFKVVFAGLHNVLRTTRQANHPLAHFGEPIEIGAMLSNGEWRQAQALVREPLRAVGCEFEEDELSTRILAQTNYYPSLIQLYGAELVRRLRDSTKTFPYVVGDDDINAAYSSQELGSAIRERFLLTLQLDPRYEVIAYALTQEVNGEADLGQGLDHDKIADVAKTWWPEGFNVTDVEFGMLLQEMAGLGVLRSIDQGRRYTLRNPNILLLLGNSDDIEKTLSKKRELPTVYEPASFRARYPRRQQSFKRRGPLTYRQESDIRAEGGVAVISGCAAAGLEHVAEFLQQRIEPEWFQTLQSISSSDKFEQELNDLSSVGNMVTVYLVPLTANWDASWVAAAKRFLAKEQRIWSKIVFTATPEVLWQMSVGEPDLRDMNWIQIGPWDKRFLRHWLEDINFTADAAHVNELMEVSGGWPVVLDKFGEKPPSKSWSTRIEELNRELIKDRAMQDFGMDSEEVKRLLRALLSEDAFDSDSIEVASVEVGLDNAKVLQRVEWSERLGLVSRVRDGCWEFNPLIRRLLEESDLT